MTQFQEIAVSDLKISEYNERTKTKTSPEQDTFEEDIADNGIEDPPLVRPSDDPDYEWEIVCGQRRFNAAKKAGFENIVCKVKELSDFDAAVASTRENHRGSLGQNVSLSERSLQLWKATQAGETSEPSRTYLSDEFGVPRTTIGSWIEPLHDEWKNTPIDPRFSSENQDDDAQRQDVSLQKDDGTYEISGNRIYSPLNIDAIGSSKLSTIRRIDGDMDDKLQLVYLVKESEMPERHLTTLREYIKSGQCTLNEFIESEYTDFNRYTFDLSGFTDEYATDPKGAKEQEDEQEQEPEPEPEQEDEDEPEQETEQEEQETEQEESEVQDEDEDEQEQEPEQDDEDQEEVQEEESEDSEDEVEEESEEVDEPEEDQEHDTPEVSDEEEPESEGVEPPEEPSPSKSTESTPPDATKEQGFKAIVVPEGTYTSSTALRNDLARHLNDAPFLVDEIIDEDSDDIEIQIEE